MVVGLISNHSLVSFNLLLRRKSRSPVPNDSPWTGNALTMWAFVCGTRTTSTALTCACCSDVQGTDWCDASSRLELPVSWQGDWNPHPVSSWLASWKIGRNPLYLCLQASTCVSVCTHVSRVAECAHNSGLFAFSYKFKSVLVASIYKHFDESFLKSNYTHERCRHEFFWS